MWNSDPPQFYQYNWIFANICHLILLINSFNILLRMLHLLRSKRQRGRHKQTVYSSFHVHCAVTQAPLHLQLAQNRSAIWVSICNIWLYIYIPENAD